MMKIFLKVLVIFLIVGVMFGTGSASGQFLFFLENPLVGKPAPDFTLKTISGEQINMAEYRDGRPAVMFFWAIWCPHCRIELQRLQERQSEFTEKDIRLLVVDLGEPRDLVKSYLKDNDITLDVLLDEDSKVADEYMVLGVPTYFLVNRKGVVKGANHTLPKNYEKILAKE